MGFGDELRNDFMQTLAMLGMIIGGVVVFTLYTVSMWLLVLALVLGAAVWYLWKMRR
jgi:hypothetical protein